MSDNRPVRGQGTDGSRLEVVNTSEGREFRLDSNGDGRVDATVTVPRGQNGAYFIANNEVGSSSFGSVLNEQFDQRFPGGLNPTEVTEISETIRTIVMSAGPLPTRNR